MGLRRTLRHMDALEQRLQRCGDQGLSATLETIRHCKLRQSAGFLEWLHEPSAITSAMPSARPTAAPAEARELIQSPSRSASGSGEVRVLEHRQVTSDLIILKVQRPSGFSFLPGQSSKIGVADVKRRYSIASAPHEPFLEFFIELFPGGAMSEHLRQLKPGDRIAIESPKGSFLLDETVSQHLMLATVTGISPFLSILRHHLQLRDQQADQTGRHRFIVIHGASYQDEFGYREELEQLASALPQGLSYIPAVSRADEPRNEGWLGERGRVDAVAETSVKRFNLSAASTCVYACGHPGMVDGVQQQFRQQGFTLKTEPYS